MDFSSPTPSLTPSVGSFPPIPVQPDHFYRLDDNNAAPSSPRSFDGKTWYDPDDDRLASRGIPVFKPTMEEFRDFEAYMNRVECWGMLSGIVKVIPPKEWRDALPSVEEQLSSVQIKTPIEQHMLGQAGLFRQQNMEKRKTLSVREWAELCGQHDYRAPSVDEIGLHARTNVKVKTRKTRRSALAAKADTADPDIAGQVHVKEEPVDDALVPEHVLVPNSAPSRDVKPKVKGKRQAQPKLTKEEKDADRIEKDAAFLNKFDPHVDWLPFNTRPEDYTPEFCAKLERHFWRNCGLGKPPWYGADTQGSLYTDDTTEWNVAHLESELSRLLPSSDRGLPGVNTPYLYWGMWRATFAWHVEDMDLFSINYIHFGAPKFWYAIPQGRAGAFEQTMRSHFPSDTSQCPQFLRHKSFLASPTLLAKSSCKPNQVVQHAGEFIITYPRGYHAGFNLGLNCAESVNFALKSWIALGRIAKACKCVSDSVTIDVDKLLADRAAEREEWDFDAPFSSKAKSPTTPPIAPVKQEELYVTIPPLSKKKRKRAPQASSAVGSAPKAKKARKSTGASSSTSKVAPTKPPPKLSIKLKLGPRPPPEPEAYPCCLCVSTSREGLLRVHDPPLGRKEALEACGNPAIWMAHESCANVVPETWVDEVETNSVEKERAVFGVDGIVKDRWNLKCTACTKTRPKAHGAPIQCTKGKCPKAFHVSCARDGKENDIVFTVLREVEKEVVLLDAPGSTSTPVPTGERMEVDTPFGAASTSAASVACPSPANVNGEGRSNVLKIIRKVEVQVFCVQHNPAVAAAKKASKQDKIKNDLLALAPMSRIKIRVSAGVFEVSLVRVIPEIGSVEVLWDRGIKREFKWGSVVFGSIDGPIQQKPSEPAPEPANPTFSTNLYRNPTAPVLTGPRPLVQPHSSMTPTQYTPTGYNAYDYWRYQGQSYAPTAPQAGSSYSYAAYQPSAAGPSSTYSQVPTYGGSNPWHQLLHHNSSTVTPPTAVSRSPYITLPASNGTTPAVQTFSIPRKPTSIPTPAPTPSTSQSSSQTATPVQGNSSASSLPSSDVQAVATHTRATPASDPSSFASSLPQSCPRSAVIQAQVPAAPSPHAPPHPQTSSQSQSGAALATSQTPTVNLAAFISPEQLANLVRNDPELRKMIQSALGPGSIGDS